MNENKNNANKKASIRLAVTETMREAFNRLKSTRYTFLKEDEILKLAFSKLYAQEYSPVSRQTSLDVILTKIHETDPEFGLEWLKKNNLKEKNLTVDSFCEMILASKK